MSTTYSIAEARDQFASLVREVELNQQYVQVTRRGAPVAVILSQSEYERLLANQPPPDFWAGYARWREKWGVNEWDENDDPFANVRDQTPPREVNLWD